MKRFPKNYYRQPTGAECITAALAVAFCVTAIAWLIVGVV